MAFPVNPVLALVIHVSVTLQHVPAGELSQQGGISKGAWRPFSGIVVPTLSVSLIACWQLRQLGGSAAIRLFLAERQLIMALAWPDPCRLPGQVPGLATPWLAITSGCARTSTHTHFRVDLDILNHACTNLEIETTLMRKSYKLKWP